MKTIEFDIKGMTCEHCVTTVKRALESVPGVTDVSVSLEKAMASLKASPDLSTDKLIKTVEHAGYSAALISKKGDTIQSKTFNRAQELVIIGGGSAGFAAAIKAVDLGAKATIIERSTIGGTCVNVGCVPSKILINAAKTYFHGMHHNFKGVKLNNGVVDFKTVVEEKDSLVSELRKEKYEAVLGSYDGMTYIQGQAAINLDDSGQVVVKVNEKILKPDKVVIAAGSHSWAPSIPGLDKVKYLTNIEAMALKTLPKNLIVIGGSAMGLELAQTFSRLGLKVSIIEALPSVLMPEGQEIGNTIANYLKDEGIECFTGATIDKVQFNGRYSVEFHANGKELSLDAEQLLVTTGRRANTSGYGLKDAGVELGDKGVIKVNQYLQTSHPDIYAAGDVTGDPMFVYVAAYGGNLAAENAILGNRQLFDLSVVPRVTFTDPQVASVGLNEEQAKKAGLDYKVSSLDMKYVPRALAERDTKGLIKLIAHKGTDRLIGAQIIGSEAGDMIMEAVLAMRYNITTQQLAVQMHPYLTHSEGIKLAAQSFDKDVSRLSCCSA